MSLLQASEIKVRKFVYQGGNLFSGYLIPLYRSTILTKIMGKQEFMIDILDHQSIRCSINISFTDCTETKDTETKEQTALNTREPTRPDRFWVVLSENEPNPKKKHLTMEHSPIPSCHPVPPPSFQSSQFIWQKSIHPHVLGLGIPKKKKTSFASGILGRATMRGIPSIVDYSSNRTASLSEVQLAKKSHPSHYPARGHYFFTNAKQKQTLSQRTNGINNLYGCFRK